MTDGWVRTVPNAVKDGIGENGKDLRGKRNNASLEIPLEAY
jgi:hypothetical protein